MSQSTATHDSMNSMIPLALNESFRTTLLSGGYSILLGSGISLDSTNGTGKKLRSAEDLRKDLCQLKGVREATTLQRVAALLNEAEREVELIQGFRNCKAGASLLPLPNFVWKRLFTFNIDDVIEQLYAADNNARQKLVRLNYNSTFEPTADRGELHLVHLHGSVMSPENGFVFSHSEYARVMTGHNIWMQMLAQTIPTESFIIAGTTLNEIDLEYYLSFRSEATPRRSRGPSFLIEPNPDLATEEDCKRYGLTLVKGTLGEFLSWLKQEIPNPPSPVDLVVPPAQSIFPATVSPSMLLKFFCDFKLVEAGEMPRSAIPSPFLYGREPAKEDLDQHIDIARADTVPLLTFVEAFVAGRSVSANEPRLLTIFDQAGTGKTTILKRAAHELARRGIPVFVVHTLSRIEVRNTIDCLRTASVRLVLVVDGLADHAEQIREILQDGQLLDKIVVLAAERSYRRQHIELMFNETPWKLIEPKPLDKSELRQLIELYRSYGLVGNADAIRSPSTYASHLRGDPIAVAVCRILNDFKPLQNIVESLWNATDSRFRMPYLCAAIAKHCHVSGIRYATLQSIAGSKNSLSDLLARDVPLGLAENNENDDYVVPLNASVSETILQWRVEIDGDSILEAFRNISSRIAFYVNRLAIITRTPEARLAGRLFDADKVVKPLLRNKAAQLYETCQKDWEWNSRFWEQRALLIADSDLETALRYARHAVAIEHHPYPLTTLGKLLLRRMEVNFSKGSSAFDEAFGILGEAINIEGARSRVTVHPYTNLFSGSIRFIEMGGEPNSKQREMLLKHIANARYWFPNDPTVQVELVRLSEMLR